MIIDRKYTIKAKNACKRGIPPFHTEHDSILFLAKDKAVPAMLRAYREECERIGCEGNHLLSIDLLIHRVIDYQEEHGAKVPDTDTPEEVFRCVNQPAQEILAGGGGSGR